MLKQTPNQTPVTSAIASAVREPTLARTQPRSSVQFGLTFITSPALLNVLPENGAFCSAVLRYITLNKVSEVVWVNYSLCNRMVT